MAAVLQADLTANTLAAATLSAAEQVVRSSTEISVPKSADLPFARIVQPRTEPSTSARRSEFRVPAAVREQRAPQLSSVSTLSEVNAVVDEIMTDSVIICCLLPEGPLNLRLPPSLIPGDLLTFGQPISISLSTEGGVRAPVIRRRDIPAQAQFPDQPEIDRWIDFL
jgi:hypothetical protein